MRASLIWFVFVGVVAAPVSAEAILLYRDEVPIRFGDWNASGPLEIHAEAASETGPVTLSAALGLGAALPILARAMTEAISAFDGGCGASLSAWDGEISVAGDRLRLTAAVRGEVETCGKVKIRLARETGSVSVMLRPSVRDGSVRIEVDEFGVRDLSSVSRFLGVDAILESRVRGVVDDLNARPELARPPAPFGENGYVYESAGFEEGGAPRARLAIRGPGDAPTLLRIAAGLADVAR